MSRRGRLGVLSLLLVSLPLVGCASPATPDHAAEGETASERGVGKPAETLESGSADAIALQFVDAPPGLVVSCEDCPGLPRSKRFQANEFPPLAAAPGTRITIKLLAPGFVGETRKVVLKSAIVDVPASLRRL